MTAAHAGPLQHAEPSEAVTWSNQAGCALILIDNPPVNATSQAVRTGLHEALRQTMAAADVKAVVIACEGRTFVAGAEIRDFGKPPAGPHLSIIADLIEASPKPVVAAIHGTALGGGFEIALSCHGRVALAGSKVGLPEVKLGIIPGAGGTQRLPRLCGLVHALDIIGSGRHLSVSEARDLGLVDLVIDRHLREEAVRFALSLAGSPLRRTCDLDMPSYDRAAFDKAAAELAIRSRGQSSPRAVVEALRAAATQPFRGGLIFERSIFEGLVGSDQAKALRHAFFAEREVQRVPSVNGIPVRAVATVGLIGAGTMGAGIAASLLAGGLEVRVVEMNPDRAETGRKRIEALLDRAVTSGRMHAQERGAQGSRLHVESSFHALDGVNFVIEAAFEDMDVKKGIFARLGSVTQPGTILATNTSYLDVDVIAASCDRPADVIGMHFFSPANVMRLVEVVRGKETAPDVLASTIALAKRMGKLPVTCGVCDGFVGNRILSRWRQLAEFALEEGGFPEEIDAALEAYGFAMGPFAVMDLAGLDVTAGRRRSRRQMLAPGVRYSSTIADRLFELGHFGRKTGRGFYVYGEGWRRPNPDVPAIAAELSGHGVTRSGRFDLPGFQRRVLAAMANEGAKILEEKIVDNPNSIDVIQLNGYGFPVWRGGPMYQADEVGLSSVLETVKILHHTYGSGWEPANIICEFARKKLRFADFTAISAKK